MSSDYVVIKIFSNEIDAAIASGMLAENGVRSTITKDDIGGMGPQLQLTHGVHLAVPFEQSEVAIEILNANLKKEGIDARTDPSASNWICTQCGEELEEQFSACWNCGHQR